MVTATVPNLVDPQTDEYWGRLGIFPGGLTERSQREDLERKVRTALSQLGVGNLRLLCEQAKIPRADTDDQSALTNRLVAASPSNTLIHLREFLQKRLEVTEETYATTFPEGKRREHEASVRQLGSSREQLKTFTKLVLLYRNQPKALGEIYFLKLSRGAAASFHFEPETGKLAADAAKRLHDKAGPLEHAIKAALSDRPIRLNGIQTLRSGVTVIAFDRQFSGVVRPDYHKQYTVHFHCGRIVLCVLPHSNRIELRLKNQAVANAVLPVLNSALGTKLQLSTRNVFREYDPDKLGKALLAEYPESSGLLTTGIKFRRTALPNQAPVSIEVAPHAASIREDLAACQASGIVQLRSLLDLEQLTLAFGAATATIGVERSRNGYITLTFDNTDWDPTTEDNFREAFRETFDVPLNRPIDPSKMTMGQEGVYGYLLEVKTVDQVLPYQKTAYDELLKTGFLTTRATEVRICRNAKCGHFRKNQPDPKKTNCAKCGVPLTAHSVVRVFPNAKRVHELLESFFRDAGWELGSEERQFEKTKYYQLAGTDAEGIRQLAALVRRDVMDDKFRSRLERSSRAVVHVKPRIADRTVFLDSAGVGNISLAYLLAASETPAIRTEAVGRLKTLMDDLQRDHSRRVFQSAQRSSLDLRDKTGITDKEFETDVFNVLRGLFPETIKLGREGKAEPDGFVGLPWYPDGSYREGKLWTWSYDAKLAETAKPYDLSSDEYRKIKDYIDKLRAARALFNKDKRLMAHVLITNRLEPGRVKVAAEYLAGDGGVKPENREVVLVLMELPFLLRLHERVRTAESAFRHRGPHLATELKKALGTRGPDGFAHLTEATANDIANEVLQYDPIHPVVKEGDLKDSLNKV